MSISTDINKKLEELSQPELSLWAPGPHMLTPAVQDVLKSYQATYSHRSAEFKTAYKKASQLLREVFSIPDGYTPLIFGHTGSYNWEMVVANTPSTYQTLGMDIGAFSKKWTQVFNSHNRHVDVMTAAWGEGFDNQDWSNKLNADQYDLALLIHNETATGVMLPVQEFCDTARAQSPNTLLAIDAVSIAGAANVPIDQLRPDYYLWSLQKDFSCPTIGSVMVVSDRAFEVAEQTPERGYVLDLIEWRTRALTDQTPMTVADLTLHCLSARLEEMKAEGDDRFRRHKNLTQMQQAWAKKHGLSLLANPGYESLTVSAIQLPKHINGSQFVSLAKKHLNVQLGPGYGGTKDVAFRIAAMGHTTEANMQKTLEGLTLLLDNWEELNT